MADERAFSHSEASCYKSCPQKYEWRYVRHYAPIREPRPFVLGRAVHEALAEFYRGEDAAAMLEAAVDQFSEALKAAGAQQDLDDLAAQQAIAEGMVLAYATYYMADRERWKVLKVEEKGSYPVRPGWRKNFTVDLLVEEGGAPWLVEHKTAAQIDQGYVARLGVDEQISTYILGVEKAWGVRPLGVVYNVIRKPGIRQRQKETRQQFLERLAGEYAANPSEYFYRERVIRSDEQLAQFAEFDKLLTADIESRERSGFWWRNTRECNNRGGCPYLPLCARGEDEARGMFVVRPDDRYAEEEK